QIPRSVADPRKRTSGISYDSISSSSSSQGYVASRAPELTCPGKGSASMYDTFMSLTPQEIAEELTRIDWADFSKITAREVIRHQSLPMEVRLKARNLEHMNNIIKRFN